MAKKTAIFEIINRQGFHARPAALVAQKTGEFHACVTIRNVSSGVTAAGNSVLSLLTLAAPCGTKMEISADGDDAEQVIAELGKIFERGFDEE